MADIPHNPSRRHFLSVAAAASARVAATTAVGWTALTSSANARICNPPCFVRGTSILTSTGEVRVEELKIGDLVETVRGKAVPVKWIGRRSYKTGNSSWHNSVVPIRIRRQAIDEHTPGRDLYLSPRHSLLIDGVLMEVQDLVNGVSIAPARPTIAEKIEYFHIVLDTHEVVLAEGLPAETFLITEREYERFSNFGEYERLYGPQELAPMTPFAPRIASSGRAHLKALVRLGLSYFVEINDPLEVAYARIAQRAAELV